MTNLDLCLVNLDKVSRNCVFCACKTNIRMRIILFYNTLLLEARIHRIHGGIDIHKKFSTTWSHVN